MAGGSPGAHLPLRRRPQIVLSFYFVLSVGRSIHTQEKPAATEKRAENPSLEGSAHKTLSFYYLLKMRNTLSPVTPAVQPFAFTKTPMNAGEFANLQCIVPSGDLPLVIKWSYPGEEMGGSSGVITKKVADRVSMLMISAITAKHAGDYVCTAENAAGTSSYTTQLTVNGSRLYNDLPIKSFFWL